MILASSSGTGIALILGQHRTIPALRLKHRSGSCGTAFALPKCSIMSGCGTRIVLRGQKTLALCDRCPCFGSLFPPLAALTFAASSMICAFGLAFAAPRSPYRHLELCGIALGNLSLSYQQDGGIRSRRNIGYVDISNFCNVPGITAERASFIMFRNGLERSGALGEIPLWAIPPTQLFFPFLAP